MSVATVSLLAVGLAMDATAVSAARGAIDREARWRGAARAGLLFGGFQGLMPLCGWLLGERFGPMFAAWDHWIAFALLAAIGVKSIADGLRGAERPAGDPTGWRVMILLAVATSIDAFAAGLTLPVLGAPIAVSVAAIAGVTAVASAAAFLAGERLARRLGGHLHTAGGLVLIGLAIQVLARHLG